MATTRAYGAWTSPLTAAAASDAGVSVGGARASRDGARVTFAEARPREGGRAALVEWRAGGLVRDLVPRDVSVRSRVFEYGGGAWAPLDDGVGGGGGGGDGERLVYSHFGDSRLYVTSRRRSGDGAAAPSPPPPPPPPGRALTPPTRDGGVHYRFADPCYDARRDVVYCVREEHPFVGAPATAVLHKLVAVPCHSAAGDVAELPLSAGDVLAEGHDFYMSHALSPCGSRLAFVRWNHPAMPWDSSELVLARLSPPGASPPTIGDATVVAGGGDESVVSPQFSPGGDALYFVSDRDGWWHLYRLRLDGGAGAAVELVYAPARHECSDPPWVFANHSYAFIDATRIVLAQQHEGGYTLVLVDTTTLRVTPIQSDDTAFSSLSGNARGCVVCTAASPLSSRYVLRLELAPGETTPRLTAVTSRPLSDAALTSCGETFSFDTSFGERAHACLYAPRNPAFVAPAGDVPPVVVMSHGGPTSRGYASLEPSVQFFTTRGFAVVDVQYRGSTGFGRAYRSLLRGRWGVVDVDDCVYAVRHLATEGRVDAKRAMIRGCSAGGYTTLAALAFRPGAFVCGTSLFGIGDLRVLLRETHKQESRYLDGLLGLENGVGAAVDERSPSLHLDAFESPILLLQGSDDKIVTPACSRSLYEAVKAKGVPTEYIEFPGEGHGFRAAAAKIRAFEAELIFYRRVLGLEPTAA